jgi:hypothetical protein
MEVGKRVTVTESCKLPLDVFHPVCIKSRNDISSILYTTKRTVPSLRNQGTRKERLQCEQDPRTDEVCEQFGTEDSFESVNIFRF